MTGDQAQPTGRRPITQPQLWRYGLAVVASIVLIAGGLYGLSTAGRKETASQDCPLAGAVASALRPLAQGQVAALTVPNSPARLPDITFQNQDGAAIQLASFRGRTILLNLWATWCVPCRQEMPALDALQRRLGGPKFEVVAVNVDTARLEQRLPFLQKVGIHSLAFYSDPSGQVLRGLQTAGPVVGLPTSLLVAADGCKIGAMLGPADWASQDARNLISATVERTAHEQDKRS
jgi:thiol-disulfide isomerase/thioredoxin